jgi:CRP-like cAMP-binding protein
MNCLLAALTPEDRATLAPVLEEREFEAGRVLHEVDRPADHVCFPVDAIVSHSAEQDGGTAVETGTVGREGVTSLAALIGDGVSFERAVVQVPGRIIVAPVAAVRDLFDHSPRFRRLIGAYAQAYAAQVSQSVVCNATHPNEARLSRWLLMCLDQTGKDSPLPLSARFLAEMLSIGRPAVTVVAGTLQTAGLIRFAPNSITILDRAGLEEASCDCYRRVRRTFERLLPGSYG